MNGLLNLAFVVLKYITAVSIVLPVSVLVAGLRLAKLSTSHFRTISFEPDGAFVPLGTTKQKVVPSKVNLR